MRRPKAHSLVLLLLRCFDSALPDRQQSESQQRTERRKKRTQDGTEMEFFLLRVVMKMHVRV